MNDKPPATSCPEPPAGARKIDCHDIQAVLFDYMTRELGHARSELIREHLRRCDECKAAAGEIQATLNLLKSTSQTETGLPERLSEERRARIRRASAHPVLDWIGTHHIIVSIVLAAAVVAAVISILQRVELWSTETPDSVTVTIGLPGEEHAEPGAEQAP